MQGGTACIEHSIQPYSLGLTLSSAASLAWCLGPWSLHGVFSFRRPRVLAKDLHLCHAVRVTFTLTICMYVACLASLMTLLTAVSCASDSGGKQADFYNTAGFEKLGCKYIS